MVNKLESQYNGNKKLQAFKELLTSIKENKPSLNDKFNKLKNKLERIDLKLKKYNNNCIHYKLYLLLLITKKRNLWMSWLKKVTK